MEDHDPARKVLRCHITQQLCSLVHAGATLCHCIYCRCYRAEVERDEALAKLDAYEPIVKSALILASWPDWLTPEVVAAVEAWRANRLADETIAQLDDRGYPKVAALLAAFSPEHEGSGDG